MSLTSPVRATAAALGILAVLLGIAGFFALGIAGNPDTHPVFVTGQILDLTHIITGTLALYIAFGVEDRLAAGSLVALGVFYLGLVAGAATDATIYGMVQWPLNGADQVLHLVIAVAAIGVGGWGIAQRPRNVAAPS